MTLPQPSKVNSSGLCASGQGAAGARTRYRVQTSSTREALEERVRLISAEGWKQHGEIATVRPSDFTKSTYYWDTVGRDAVDEVKTGT
jgi:hypothetical protein